ncbi:MAG: AtpZ/AtpI family protein [Bacteroidota bacterium]
MPTEDPWADKPDRFDRADREWARRWAEPSHEEEPDPLAPAGDAYPPRDVYQPQRATPGRIKDAYGDGMREAGPHLGLGIQIGGSMLLFVGLGILVDRWLDTTPWGVIVGAALGMVGIVALVVRVANESSSGSSR